MRNYEVMLIVHPDLDENALNELIDKVKGWIGDSGGSVEKVDRWGKRRMAYEIRKQREAHYVLLHAKITPAFIAELERNLRLNEMMLRYLIHVVEE